jgi:ribonuclease VapC
MVSYLNREAGCQKVLDVMANAQKSGDTLFMNEINIGEVFHIVSRKRGLEKGEYFIETIVPSLPLSPVPNTFDDVIEAARIKAEYPLSFADCFTVATARKQDCTIITGDQEFKRVEHLVDIDWM